MDNINERNHRFGRIFLALAILLICLVPLLICVFLQVVPEWLVVLKSLIPLIVFFVGGIVEVITYAPMVGTSATYLSFFTGNLVNLKIPCAVNAREQAGVENGSKEGEIVSTVSIGVSTIVTTIILALGVILMTPLTPVLENPVIKPAADMAFTALFGALAYKYFVKDPILVPIPFVLTIVLQVLANVGKSVLIPVSAIVTILFGYFLFKKENKKVVVNEDKNDVK